MPGFFPTYSQTLVENHKCIILIQLYLTLASRVTALKIGPIGQCILAENKLK